MKQYIDKNNKIIKEENFILVDEKVCQALRCDDGTLLYEELEYNFNKGKIELIDDPNYPDSFERMKLKLFLVTEQLNY